MTSSDIFVYLIKVNRKRHFPASVGNMRATLGILARQLAVVAGSTELCKALSVTFRKLVEIQCRRRRG
jgi:hypothetical protein